MFLVYLNRRVFVMYKKNAYWDDYSYRICKEISKYILISYLHENMHCLIGHFKLGPNYSRTCH